MHLTNFCGLGGKVVSCSLLAMEINLKNSHLRTFAPNFSNIDFFLEILPLKDDELVMSEM